MKVRVKRKVFVIFWLITHGFIPNTHNWVRKFTFLKTSHLFFSKDKLKMCGQVYNAEKIGDETFEVNMVWHFPAGVLDVLNTKCTCTNGKVFTMHGFRECSACHGTGEVPGIWEKWKPEGKNITYWMFYHGLTLRKASKILSIGICDLSDARIGRADPAPVIEKIRALGYTIPEQLTCPKCGGTDFQWVEEPILGKIRKCMGCEE